MSQLKYWYETHLHTAESSACANYTGAEQVRHYKERKYTGVIITDHFFNGNTSVPSHLPWEERVNRFCLGYENAKREGERIGLDVFFGWEANFRGSEFLIYGLDKEWLLAHPQIMEWGMEEQYRYVSRDGGMVVQAHPFREAYYIKEVRAYPDCVDALEGVNASNPRECNRRALDYASGHGLPVTGGSDEHGGADRRCGMAFGSPLRDVGDYITRVKAGRGYEIINIKKYA